MRTTLWMLALLIVIACGPPPHRPSPPATPIVTGTVEVDGGHLYFEEAGAGEAIVLVHGGFGDRRMWIGVFEDLARDHRVIRYDHRGFGKSSFPTAAYAPVADLMRLLDDRHVERAHLIGNSMGGTLVIDAALLHPERVASITVVASGPGGAPTPPDVVDSVNHVFLTAEAQGLDAAVELWIAHPMVAVTSKLPGPGRLLREMITDNRALFTIAHWPDEPMQPPAVARLADVRAPTLIVIGDRDWPYVQASAELAATGIPGATKIVMPGADHLPQLVDPERFLAAVRAFLPRPDPDRPDAPTVPR